MTIRMLQAYNGKFPGQIVSGLGGTEETRLINLGFASADLDGPAVGGDEQVFDVGAITGTWNRSARNLFVPGGADFTLALGAAPSLPIALNIYLDVGVDMLTFAGTGVPDPATQDATAVIRLWNRGGAAWVIEGAT